MHWGSILAGLPQRTEDALWSGEPFGGFCCRNMITLSHIRPDWQWPGREWLHLPLGFPQLTIQNITSELRAVRRLPAGDFYSDLESLNAKGAEGTFLNVSHFHLNELQLLAGQGPSHCHEGSSFLLLLAPPVVAHRVCEKEEAASFYCGTQTLGEIWSLSESSFV